MRKTNPKIARMSPSDRDSGYQRRRLGFRLYSLPDRYWVAVKIDPIGGSFAVSIEDTTYSSLSLGSALARNIPDRIEAGLEYLS